MPANLSGILVVALEQAVAVPLCTSRLAEAGARVIKVERAEGDFARRYDTVANGESAYFVWLNRGKQSIALDIKNPEDAVLLQAMIARADVFIQNLAPGAAARAGFGSDRLRARHSGLITCDVTGYADSGPWADMKAYDFLIQCETGLASVTGSRESPARVGVSVADICCGMNAHAGILEALYKRERDGVGSSISVSLFDGLADWMTVPLLHLDYGGAAPARTGMHHPSIAPYGSYRTADGELVVAVQNDREWDAFCAGVLQIPTLRDDSRFASNARRCANRTALDSIINACLDHLPLEDVKQRLAIGRIAFGTVNDVAGLSAHPQLRRVTVETPSGNISLPGHPVLWQGDASQPVSPVPQIDEHGSALRKEFA
jgi:itaconate CoA-transferase